MENPQKRQNPFERNQTTERDSEPTDVAKRGDFANYPISERTVETLKSNNYKYLFPIQQATYIDIYEGSDLIGRDRTGSGKTLAFALPLLERLRKREDVLVNKRGQRPVILAMVPTRELAIQVTKEFEKLRNSNNEFRVLSVYGGTDIGEQILKLRSGVEVVVGTPGRIMDLQERRDLIFSDLRALILDETDQMLNIGFQDDIERILATIKKDMAEKERTMSDVQVLLFSATIPRWVEKIAFRFMKRDVVRADMIKDSSNKTSTTVEHYCISFPNREQKISAIGDVVMVYGGVHSRTIIFTDTKEEANDIMLNGQLKMDMQVLHGDIPQNQREVTFKSFRSGKLKCLVATNVAARGLDISDVDLIIQLSPPKEIDTYIHRSGRTGRAGKSGVCITFYSKMQKEFLDKIEFKAGVKVKKMGIPQPEDIIRASARDIAHAFDKVSDDVLNCFEESVNDILEHYDPKEALCRALAIISGYTKAMKQRSLLFSTEGYVTYVIETDEEVRSLSFFHNFLRGNFAPHIADSVKGMRFLKSHYGAVFDLDEKLKDQFEDTIESLGHKTIKIFAAKELPEIEDREMGGFGGGGFGGFGGRRDFNDSRGKQSFGEPRKHEFTNSKRTGGNLGNGLRRENNDDKKSDDQPREYNTERRNTQGDDRRRDNNDDRRNTYNDGQKSSGGNFTSSKSDNTLDKKLFVANTGDHITEADITDFLTQAGFIPTSVTITRTETGASKGFGYIEFNDNRTAKAAMDELSATKMKDKQLRVSFAMQKK